MAGVPTQGQLNIVIQMPETAGGETGTVDGNAPSPVNPRQETNTSGDPVAGDKNQQAKLSMALQTAKTVGMQGLNAAVSNIGLATGNYYQQRQAQKTIQAGQTIVALASSASNIYTFIATVAGMAISAGSEIYAQNKEREIANYQAEQYAKRLGFTVDRR